MNPIEATKICLLRKPLSFWGKASKGEFWGYAFLYFLFFMGFPWLIFAIETNINVSRNISTTMFSIWGIISLVGLIPLICAAVRRLRDAGNSGWAIFLIFLPVFGLFLLLWLLKGDAEQSTDETEQ